jgi:hypothetical protein
MIRVAQEGQKAIAVLFGQWEMIITFFKHGLEIPLCINPDNEMLREQHRLSLTAIMSMGELLLARTKNLKDDEIEAFGYSRSFLSSNVRYLRDTYQQWYVERDSNEVEAAYQKICDALTRTAPANSGA